MADIAITAASVIAGANANIDRSHNAGVTVTAGQAVYLDSSAHTWKLADADGATQEIRTATGIALNGAGAGQPLAVQTSGLITIGATLTAGLQYFLSNTAGGICLVADIGAGEYVDEIGIATTTTVLDLNFRYTGVSN